MSFVVSIFQSFNCFLKPLQTSFPMIYRLYSVCHGLLHELLEKGIIEKLSKKDDNIVSAKKLKEIDL